MKIPGSVVTVCTLLSCVVFAFGSSAKQLASKNRPTINTSKWNEISLPFRPFNVTAIDGSMWVCGTNEMIAVSHDAGATWQIRHQKQNGEVLLNIVFVDSMVGHAAGSGGLLLSTTDGGQTWSSHVAGSTIKQFSFSSPSEGIADVNGVVKLTSDGGDHWQEVEAIHLAIALHQPQGEDIFLSTVDSGKTWTPTHINNTFAGALFVHDREYWAFGIEYLGRENNPGGGYSVPVTLHSQDALSWQHGVRETNESSGCTRQGCFLPYGVVEGLYGNEEKIWSLPQNLPLTSKWAMAKERICMISSGLKCGSVLASDVPQPAPNHASSDMFQVTYNQPFAEGCLDCHLQNMSPDPSLGGRPLNLPGIVATFTVNRDGSTRNISMAGIPSKKLSNKIAAQISTWLITPSHEGSATVEMQRQIKLRLLCFPGFPGHPETANCSVMLESPRTSVSPSMMVVTSGSSLP